MKAITPYFFERDRLRALAERERGRYAEADPFPHAVLDGLVPDEVLRQVLEEFPSPGGGDWLHYRDQKKSASIAEGALGPFTRHFLSQLNSSVFLSFVEELTGIEGLVADSHYFGGGLHEIARGGQLGVHVDFNWNARLRLDRRVNLLLYLNPDWREEYGGHLELWDATVSTCRQRILPIFNRTVIFTTSRVSYHGHPVPTTAPQGTARRSLALYYYSNGRPAGEDAEPHLTVFRRRPSEGRRLSVRGVARSLLPPIFGDLAMLYQQQPQTRVGRTLRTIARRSIPPFLSGLWSGSGGARRRRAPDARESR